MTTCVSALKMGENFIIENKCSDLVIDFRVIGQYPKARQCRLL